jgi:hypothetical protein
MAKDLINFSFHLHSGNSGLSWSLCIEYDLIEKPDIYTVLHMLNQTKFDQSIRQGIHKFVSNFSEAPKDEIRFTILYAFARSKLEDELDYCLMEKDTVKNLDVLENVLLQKFFPLKQKIAKAIRGCILFNILTT